jgi:hypothetical protein
MESKRRWRLGEMQTTNKTDKGIWEPLMNKIKDGRESIVVETRKVSEFKLD